MADFQLAWLYFNFSALICLLIVLLYGYHALGKKTYHSASNFRSWLLFIGTSLFFSGFFHIIGQVKDKPLFFANCSHGFDQQDELDVLPDDQAVHSYQYCFKIFHTFLICFVVIWATHSVVMLSLFFYVNQYKNENFYEEEEAAEEAHEIECEKRKFRPERSLPVRIQVQPPTPSTLDSAGLSTGSDLSW